MDNDGNVMFRLFDVDEGNFHSFIKKNRRKLRRILPKREGFFIFDGVFRGWWVIELRSNRVKVKVKINSKDFFFHGFQSSNGIWWRLNYPDNDNFGEASVFPYSGSYLELLAKAGGGELSDIDLTRETISHSVHMLSNFDGNFNDQGVPLAMIRLILTICESTRFYPIQASIHRFFRPIQPIGVNYNRRTPRLTLVQAKMLKCWNTITDAYFSKVFVYLNREFRILSRGHVRKNIAIGMVSNDGAGGDGDGRDGPNNRKDGHSRRDGHKKYEKGSASGSKKNSGGGRRDGHKKHERGSASGSKKNSGGGVKGRQYSQATFQGKEINTIAPLQPQDIKLAKLQGIHEDCIHPLAWKRNLFTTSWPHILIINNEIRMQLIHTVHTYQGRQHKILNHFRGAKEFLFRPEFSFRALHQAIQFDEDWWRNTSPLSGVLRSISPVLQQAPTIGTVTTSPYLSHLQPVHLLCASPVLRELMRMPIAVSEIPSKSENPRPSSRSSLLKWFNYAKGPGFELPLSSRDIIAGSLLGDLSTRPIDARSSFVPQRS